MTDEDFERWANVKPEAVCGGSDAQAINVFREALFFIARCRVALATEREACALVAEDWGDACATEHYRASQERNHAQCIAAAIRARGEK